MRADSFRLFPFSQFSHDATQGLFESPAGKDPAASERTIHVTVDVDGVAEARVVDCDGQDVVAGPLSLTSYMELSLLSGKQRFWAVEVFVDNIRQGVVTRATPQAGFVYEVTHQRELLSHRLTEKPGAGAWLAPGTIVSTSEGDQPVEWLESGMRVITRDRGAQPLAMVVRQRFPTDVLNQTLVSLPHIAETATQAEDLLVVSPATCMLLRDPQSCLYYGAYEVLAPAAALGAPEYAGQPGKFVTLTGLVFPSHELVQTNGGWLGSWFWTAETMAELNALQVLQALRALGLSHRQHGAARMMLTQDEASLLRPDARVIAEVEALFA